MLTLRFTAATGGPCPSACKSPATPRRLGDNASVLQQFAAAAARSDWLALHDVRPMRVRFMPIWVSRVHEARGRYELAVAEDLQPNGTPERWEPSTSGCTRRPQRDCIFRSVQTLAGERRRVKEVREFLGCDGIEVGQPWHAPTGELLHARRGAILHSWGILRDALPEAPDSRTALGRSHTGRSPRVA